MLSQKLWLTSRAREEDEEEAVDADDTAHDDEDERGPRKRAPVIQEISLPNLPNPAPTDGTVLSHIKKIQS